MPGRTCWYTVIVKAGLLWPRRSLTTFTPPCVNVMVVESRDFRPPSDAEYLLGQSEHAGHRKFIRQ